MNKSLICFAVSLSTLSLPAVTIIYQDDFNGSAGTDLNGTAPDVAPGAEVWTASDAYDTDGSVASITDTGAGAWLPFTPQAGNIYELTASFDVTTGGSDWFSVGFANSTYTNTTARAVNIGYGSYLQRENADVITATGLALDGRQDFDDVLSNSDVDVTITLDASDADASNWTVAYVAEDSLNNSITRSASAAGSGTLDNIRAVGFSLNKGATAQISSMQLAVIPEPGIAGLSSGLVVLGMILLRRRMK